MKKRPKKRATPVRAKGPVRRKKVTARATRGKKGAAAKRSITVRGKKVGAGRIFREERTYRNAKGELIRYDAIIAYIRVSPNRTQFTNWSIGKWTEPVARKRAQEWLDRKRSEQAKNFA